MGLQYELPWLKDQRSTLTFETYLSPLSHKVYISSKNKEIGFNSIQKINFSKNSHSNVFGRKFDLDVK